MFKHIRIGDQTYRVWLSQLGQHDDSVEVFVPGSGPRVMRAEVPARWRRLKQDGPTFVRVISVVRRAEP